MQFPAAIPAVALACGAITGILLSVPSSVGSILVVACSLCALIAFAKNRAALFLAAIACGFLAAGMALGREANGKAIHTSLGELFDRVVPAHEYQLVATVEGALRSDATIGVNGVLLAIDVDRIETNGRGMATSGGALVSVGGGLASNTVNDWRAGRRIRVAATLRHVATYFNPGVADSTREFAWRGTTLVGTTKSDRLVYVLAKGDWMAETLAAVRAAVRREVATSVGPWSPQSAAVVTAILIGDRAGLDADLVQRLQEAGTYHVIAISGGNIAIFAGLAVWLLKWSGAGSKSSSLLIITMLVAYALVVGGGSSVGRAATMAVVYFAARFCDHRTAPGNVAALSAVAMLCTNPLEVVDASFFLTYGATLGLIAGMPRLSPPQGLPKWAGGALMLCAAAFCAEVALFPVGAYVFSRVTIAGLVLNFAAIPMMTVVQIAGMAGVGLTWVNTHVAQAAGFVAHLGVQGLLTSAGLVRFAPWVTRRVPPPSILVMASYYGAAIATLGTDGSRRARAASVALACAVWIVLAPVVPGRSAPLRVTYLDVGQGDAAIVQFPNGRSLSVDAGGLAGASFDIGSRVVSPAYWALGVRRLDFMSLSHGDPDHIGGAPSVFRDFHPGEIWYGVPVPPHGPTRELRAISDRARVAWRTILAGDRVEIGDVHVVAHHPRLPEWERQRVRNDDSEVLEILYGGVSFVFSGDIGRETERLVAPSFERASIRVLKVPHHGSATSSSQEFLDALGPDVAVISAGRGNPFGHPVESVLERYRHIGAAVYRTDLDGAVTIETDGKTLRLRTYTNRRLTLRTAGRQP